MDRLAICLLTAACLAAAGCGTQDLAYRSTDPAPRCEVHGTVMAPQIIGLSSGSGAFIGGYLKAERKEFPHHGGSLFEDEHPGALPIVYGSVRDFVCPDCDKTWRDWWAAYHARHPSAY